MWLPWRIVAGRQSKPQWQLRILIAVTGPTSPWKAGLGRPRSAGSLDTGRSSAVDLREPRPTNIPVNSRRYQEAVSRTYQDTFTTLSRCTRESHDITATRLLSLYIWVSAKSFLKKSRICLAWVKYSLGVITVLNRARHVKLANQQAA